MSNRFTALNLLGPHQTDDPSRIIVNIEMRTETDPPGPLAEAFLSGPLTPGTLDDLIGALMTLARLIEDDTDALVEASWRDRFDAIEGAEAQLADGVPPGKVYPGWGQMSQGDRQRMLDYLMDLHTTSSAPGPLEFADDPDLASLPPKYTHAHALHWMYEVPQIREFIEQLPGYRPLTDD
ncbi:hypothetical protein MHY20_11350 [Helcobacillus sp. ACRRO]|uniref:hypothetical protein n=1 Tax=Helcobacillus sp. ACRRO TaxID=2918202 RepID=UPI001EF65187|nr:hypothetical protein [Helcobacillus sp. ACRRO]MCG7428189.1 hypothetical protein [Helcobacillus sp. ACRRO]